MSGIAPIPSGRPFTSPMSSAGAGPLGGAAGAAGSSCGASSAPAPAGGFSEALKAYVGNVNEDQQASTAAIGDLVSGSAGDVLPAVAAVVKADMSFKLLMGVRNKVIEAYKQTMNMQV